MNGRVISAAVAMPGDPLAAPEAPFGEADRERRDATDGVREPMAPQERGGLRVWRGTEYRGVDMECPIVRGLGTGGHWSNRNTVDSAPRLAIGARAVP